MLKVLEGGRTVRVNVNTMELERKLFARPGRHKKTAFPSSARKGVFIPTGMSVPEAMQIMVLAESAHPQPASSSSAPRKAGPRRPTEIDLKVAKLRLAALGAPLPGGDLSN